MPVSNRRGYTLIELVVTVLIIGILTSIAVPQYLMTVETGKADDAVATLNMIGTTNKMFALDHGGCYTSGAFPSGAGATCAGTATVCPNPASWSPCPVTVACALVACNYLADQDWGDKAYTFNSCDSTGGGGGGTCAVGLTGVAARATSGSGGSSIATYQAWKYSIAATGQITALAGGAPPPTY